MQTNLPSQCRQISFQLVRLEKSLFQLFKEVSKWKSPSEPSVPSEVVYLDVHHGQL